MVTARTAPHPIFMAMYAPLYARFARLLPNCCGPPKKIELALEALHVMRPIFFGPDILDLTASGIVLDYGAHIRHGLAKYRELVKVDRFYQSVVSRVSLGSPLKTYSRIKQVQTKLTISSQMSPLLSSTFPLYQSTPAHCTLKAEHALNSASPETVTCRSWRLIADQT